MEPETSVLVRLLVGHIGRIDSPIACTTTCITICDKKIAAYSIGDIIGVWSVSGDNFNRSSRSFGENPLMALTQC
jgi:hypothetical protein